MSTEEGTLFCGMGAQPGSAQEKVDVLPPGSCSPSATCVHGAHVPVHAAACREVHVDTW